jgi:hypothetical protein
MPLDPAQAYSLGCSLAALAGPAAHARNAMLSQIADRHIEIRLAMMSPFEAQTLSRNRRSVNHARLPPCCYGDY